MNIKNIIVHAGTAAAVLAVAASCSDWTTPESVSIDVPSIEEQESGLYAEYLLRLKSFKADEHKLSLAFVENPEGVAPESQSLRLTAYPDSLDFICLAEAENLHKSYVKGISEVGRKGTAVLYKVSYSVIESEWEALHPEDDGTVQQFDIVVEDFTGASKNLLAMVGNYLYFEPAVKQTLSVTWPGNEDFAQIDFSDSSKPQPFHIAAPAGISELTLKLTGSLSSGDGWGKESINLHDDTFADMIGDFALDVYEGMGMLPSLSQISYGENVLNATELDLNINVIWEFPKVNGITGVQTVVLYVKDSAGNEVEKTVTVNTWDDTWRELHLQGIVFSVK